MSSPSSYAQFYFRLIIRDFVSEEAKKFNFMFRFFVLFWTFYLYKFLKQKENIFWNVESHCCSTHELCACLPLYLDFIVYFWNWKISETDSEWYIKYVDFNFLLLLPLFILVLWLFSFNVTLIVNSFLFISIRICVSF